MDTTVTVSRYLLSLADAILAGLDDSHRALEPRRGAKTAGWLLGHLAVSGDFALQMCGRPGVCPEKWFTAFGPGTQPSLEPEDYPPMRSLQRKLVEVYTDLQTAFPAAQADRLAAANPYAPARASFPTVGDFVSYLMTAHLGYHLGQLAGWRAAAGLGRVERPSNLAA